MEDVFPKGWAVGLGRSQETRAPDATNGEGFSRKSRGRGTIEQPYGKCYVDEDYRKELDDGRSYHRGFQEESNRANSPRFSDSKDIFEDYYGRKPHHQESGIKIQDKRCDEGFMNGKERPGTSKKYYIKEAVGDKYHRAVSCVRLSGIASSDGMGLRSVSVRDDTDSPHQRRVFTNPEWREQERRDPPYYADRSPSPDCSEKRKAFEQTSFRNEEMLVFFLLGKIGTKSVGD